MKRSATTLLLVFLIQVAFAGPLFLIEYQNQRQLKNIYNQGNLTVHYIAADFLVATSNDLMPDNAVLLDDTPWEGSERYYVARFYKEVESAYLNQMETSGAVLCKGDKWLIAKTSGSKLIAPPQQGSLTAIHSVKIIFPGQGLNYSTENLVLDPIIVEMMEDVDTILYMSNLQHLEDYGTRNAYEPESVEAQNWIKQQFESYGYPVELFDFNMPGGPASDNVIATKLGTKYPDEYVAIGAHYDSYSFSGPAPGADDNASGVCGVMEVARVMASHDFDRTILFCAWSGEEYGLYGSEAYASWAAGEGLNILGYFNIDMCGYRYQNDPIHTDIIAPPSAQPLVDFYMDVCALYLPDFGTAQGNLGWGSSDHASFNNNGYMGIFPWEDSEHYSPYIHTSQDLIGPSVNSPEMAMVFTQAMVANVATMANWLAGPANLVGIGGDGVVDLTWDELQDVDYYNVYRNNIPTPYATSTVAEFQDTDVVNFNTYTYYVTAVFTGTGEESDPSNVVEVTPVPPMTFPFLDDFETGASYWTFEDTWGLATTYYHSESHSLNDSPDGNYPDQVEIHATLQPFSLENATEASVSFWTRYELEQNYDYAYFQVSTNGSSWTTLETFNGYQTSWTEQEYPLDNYLGEPLVFLRFRLESDYMVNDDGLFVDDLEILADINVGMSDNVVFSDVICFPNPTSGAAALTFETPEPGDVSITIFNPEGEAVWNTRQKHSKGTHTLDIDLGHLPSGLYFLSIEHGGKKEHLKIMLVK